MVVAEVLMAGVVILDQMEGSSGGGSRSSKNRSSDSGVGRNYSIGRTA